MAAMAPASVAWLANLAASAPWKFARRTSAQTSIPTFVWMEKHKVDVTMDPNIGLDPGPAPSAATSPHVANQPAKRSAVMKYASRRLAPTIIPLSAQKVVLIATPQTQHMDAIPIKTTGLKLTRTAWIAAISACARLVGRNQPARSSAVMKYASRRLAPTIIPLSAQKVVLIATPQTLRMDAIPIKTTGLKLTRTAWIAAISACARLSGPNRQFHFHQKHFQ